MPACTTVDPWHRELDRAELLHAVRRSPTAAAAAVRAALAQHFMLPGGERQAASLIAEDLVLLPYALVPVPMAPRSAPTLSLSVVAIFTPRSFR